MSHHRHKHRRNSEMDGELVHLDYVTNNSDLKTNPFDNNVFYPAEGIRVESSPNEPNPIGKDTTITAWAADGMPSETQSYAFGDFFRGIQRNRASAIKSRERMAASNAKTAAALSNSSSDIALANALAKSAPKSGTPAKKGLSTGAKIGIAVGIAAAIGIGILAYKKYKKK